VKSSTRKIDNNKDFDTELNFIKRIDAIENIELKEANTSDLFALLNRGELKFKLEISNIFSENDNLQELSFSLENKTFIVKEFNDVGKKTKISSESGVQLLTSIELDTFHSTAFKKKGRYKSFYPVELKDVKTFHNEFETVTYQRNGIEHFYDCLRITIEKRKYDLTQIKDENRGYYVFECLQDQNFEDFSDACYSIQQAVGFINKLMVGGEKFIFDGNGEFYYSNFIRPTLRGLYSPIFSNPYSKMDIERKVAEKMVNKLSRISLEDLSSLTTRIHQNPVFSVVILIILESTSIASLLLIPSSFAVIIEQLSKHLNVEEIGLDKPIDDPELESTIIDQLHQVIDQNKKDLTPENILKLKRRLNGINRPMNKRALTNNEKLTRPFEQLGIDLTLHDISIIEHRNDLFHGNVLLNTKQSRDEETTNLYMAYVSAKLFTLISKLILKSIGYSGYIYNQAKYLEKKLDLKTNEQYFDKI
tara:strand:- start:286757 stop:288184 length:1428 start_codon:yes stop_codon:yes gene_type:complete